MDVVHVVQRWLSHEGKAKDLDGDCSVLETGCFQQYQSSAGVPEKS